MKINNFNWVDSTMQIKPTIVEFKLGFRFKWCAILCVILMISSHHKCFLLTKDQKKMVWINCSNLEFLRSFHLLRIGDISIVRAYHLQVDFHLIGIRPGKICTKWPKLVPPIPRDHCNRVGSGLAIQKIDRFWKYNLLSKYLVKM